MTSQSLRKITIFLFHLLVLTVPLFFSWVNEELFEFPKMILTYLITIMITVTWVGRMIIEKKATLRSTFFDWPLLAFLLAQIFSTIFSIHPQTSIFGYYTRFHGGLLSTLTYIILFYALVNNFTKKDIHRLFITIFTAALLVSWYAIPEHFGHSLSCSFITGKFDVSCWKQDVQSRVFATFGQPNWLAAFTITLLPLGLTLSNWSKKRWSKIWLGATTLSLFATLLYTRSRSGFIGFAASMLAYGAGLWWINHQQKTTQKTKTKSGLMILVAGLILGLAAFQVIAKSSPAPAPVVNRLEVGGTDSGDIRRIVWQGAIDVWKRYPLLGSGVETFAYSYYQDRPMAHNLVSEWDFLYNKAHNELLNFLATTGIVGLLTYLVLIGSLIIKCLQVITGPQLKYSNQDKTIVLSILSGVTALSVSNFFGFSTVMVSILLFLFLGIVAIFIQKDELSLKATTHKLKAGQYIQLFVITVLALVLIKKTLQIWRSDRAYASGQAYIEANLINQGLDNFQTAIKLRPYEALFHNKLADTYSQLAVALDAQRESTASAEFKAAALEESALTLRLNPRQLNFYKSRARILINLSTLEPALLNQAEQVLQAALKLAPTDAKLMYNLGLVEFKLGHTAAGIRTLEKTLEMKPNYLRASETLEQLLATPL